MEWSDSARGRLALNQPGEYFESKERNSGDSGGTRGKAGSNPGVHSASPELGAILANGKRPTRSAGEKLNLIRTFIIPQWKPLSKESPYQGLPVIHTHLGLPMRSNTEFNNSGLKATFVVVTDEDKNERDVRYEIECKIVEMRDGGKIAVFDSEFMKILSKNGALPPSTGAKSIAMLQKDLIKKGVTRIYYENPTERMSESAVRCGTDLKRKKNKDVSFSIDSLQKVTAWAIEHPNWGPEYIAR